MAEQQQGKNSSLKENVMLGADVDDLPYDLNVTGEEDTTVWDNMVQAFKPDLTPGYKQPGFEVKQKLGDLFGGKDGQKPPEKQH